MPAHRLTLCNNLTLLSPTRSPPSHKPTYTRIRHFSPQIRLASLGEDEVGRGGSPLQFRFDRVEGESQINWAETSVRSCTKTRMARLSPFHKLLFSDRQELEHHEVGGLCRKISWSPGWGRSAPCRGGRAHGGTPRFEFFIERLGVVHHEAELQTVRVVGGGIHRNVRSTLELHEFEVKPVVAQVHHAKARARRRSGAGKPRCGKFLFRPFIGRRVCPEAAKYL